MRFSTHQTVGLSTHPILVTRLLVYWFSLARYDSLLARRSFCPSYRSKKKKKLLSVVCHVVEYMVQRWGNRRVTRVKREMNDTVRTARSLRAKAVGEGTTNIGTRAPKLTTVH